MDLSFSPVGIKLYSNVKNIQTFGIDLSNISSFHTSTYYTHKYIRISMFETEIFVKLKFSRDTSV